MRSSLAPSWPKLSLVAACLAIVCLVVPLAVPSAATRGQDDLDSLDSVGGANRHSPSASSPVLPRHYRNLSPSLFGFDIPDGTPIPGDGLCVLTNDEEGKPVVGKLHVQVKSNRIVLLPDGQLVLRKLSDAPVVDRPFKPVDKEALAAKLIETKYPGFKWKATRRYLYIYNTSEEFALATSRILETMYPGMQAHAKAQKITTYDPDVPLVAIMYKTEDEFRSQSRLPPGVVAYYQILDNRIYMFEEASGSRLPPAMQLQQTISVIAHEGAHQILHNIGVQKRLSLWPMWLAEGLAEYYAPTAPGERMRWKGAGHVNDMRMFELEQYVQSRSTEPIDGTMILDTVQAQQLTSTGYAASWALTHFLARGHKQKFNDFMLEMSKLEPFQGYLSDDSDDRGRVSANRRAFEQQFGTDLAALEQQLVAHLRKQNYTDPFADFPHHVAMLTAEVNRRPTREANTFHSRALAEKWQEDMVAKLPPETRGSVETNVRTFPNRAQAEQFAREWLRGGQ